MQISDRAVLDPLLEPHRFSSGFPQQELAGGFSAAYNFVCVLTAGIAIVGRLSGLFSGDATVPTPGKACLKGGLDTYLLNLEQATTILITSILLSFFSTDS